MKYEERILYLLDKLIESFEKLQIYFARKYALLESKEARAVITETLTWIDKLEYAFRTAIPFENPEEVSRRIIELIKEAGAARSAFSLAKSEGRVTKVEEVGKETLIKDLKVLSDRIVEYNRKVKDDQKIITIKKALIIAKEETKKMEEELWDSLP